MATTVFEALAEVISRWCGAEAGSYGMGASLDNLWRRRHPVDPPYNPDGIDSLVSRVKKAQFFQACEEAQGLNRGQFIAGGGLQTFGDLNDHLRPCPPPV